MVQPRLYLKMCLVKLKLKISFFFSQVVFFGRSAARALLVRGASRQIGSPATVASARVVCPPFPVLRAEEPQRTVYKPQEKLLSHKRARMPLMVLFTSMRQNIQRPSSALHRQAARSRPSPLLYAPFPL